MTAPASHQSFWADLYGVSYAQGYLDAAGIRTRYLHAGEGGATPLILLHGTGGHADCYTRNLAAHGAHFDTYAIDMVGHGWSDKPEVDLEIDVYVEHLRAVLDTLGFARAHVSGESLGGWVAARFALKYPERVMRLALNTTGGATMIPAVMEKIKASTRAAVRDASWAAVKARLEWLMADPSVVTDDLVACRQAIYRQPGFVEAVERILVLQEPEIRQRNNLTEDEWRAIAAETMVLWTSHDPTASDEVGQRIAGLIPNAHYVLMQGCGHWPQFEDPDTFNRIHVDFFLGKGVS
ncbi:MAG: alpha/beta fold hydrolase, partial [Gammaproteobacteria bacterium]|nr:alpha/beta fold hydrolase [Gammaproteobacteria bacterium]